MTPATATRPAGTFPADVDPATIRPDDLPGDGYGDLAEIDDFARLIRDFRAGTVAEDDFKPMRLHMGCYGIRQSDTHMVRVKAPLGRFDAQQFEAMAVIAERWSRGFAHITTRQNFQFHFVELDDVPDVMRITALAGLTTREACGNAIRNVTMSPLAGVHPDEVLDVEAAADEVVRHFLRHGQFQDLPRKFKIAFSAAADDDAGTGFHDVGVLPAVNAAGEPGYRIVLGGGLGSAPHEAVELEPFTPAELLLPTVHAALALFEDEGERRNRVRARMKFLVKKLGREEFVARILERRDLAVASGLRSTVLPHPVAASGPEADAPQELPVELSGREQAQYRYWLSTNTLRQRQGDRFAVYAAVYLGDLDVSQFRGIAELMRANDVTDARLTIRQNVVFRDVRPDRLPHLWAALADLGLDRPLAEKSGDIVSCPGAETCNLAITASRGLAEAITDRLVDEALHEIEGVRMNISGCPNSCGQHQAFDLGFSGMARRDSAGNEGPGYRVFVGGRMQDGGARFGDYVAKVPAKNAPEAASRILAKFREERAADEPLWAWYDRVGKDAVADLVADLEKVPEKADAPDYYVDWGASQTFEVILGKGECAV